MTLFGSFSIFSLTLSYYSVVGPQGPVMVLEKSPGWHRGYVNLETAI